MTLAFLLARISHCSWAAAGSRAAAKQIKHDCRLSLLTALCAVQANAKPENHFGHHILPRALREDYRVMSYHFDKYWRVRLCTGHI